MHEWVRLAIVLVILAGSREILAAEITAKGKDLAARFDAMNVEAHWLPGHPVNWKTGEPDPGERNSATHCSAFVAAVCDREGVYILHPPDHSQVLLANAQNRWLHGDGEKRGWKLVKSGAEAQALANRGTIVVASLRNANSRKPGHIALVRPSTKTAAAIAERGPAIIQAGATNYQSTSLKTGFANHPGAFDNGEIEFFAHDPASR